MGEEPVNQKNSFFIKKNSTPEKSEFFSQIGNRFNSSCSPSNDTLTPFDSVSQIGGQSQDSKQKALRNRLLPNSISSNSFVPNKVVAYDSSSFDSPRSQSTAMPGGRMMQKFGQSFGSPGVNTTLDNMSMMTSKSYNVTGTSMLFFGTMFFLLLGLNVGFMYLFYTQGDK